MWQRASPAVEGRVSASISACRDHWVVGAVGRCIGSARRKAVAKQIAVVHETVARRRRDWVEKITTRIAASYHMVAVEQLPMRNMVRRPKPKPDPDNPGQYLPNGATAKARLNKGTYANCWGLFAPGWGRR